MKTLLHILGFCAVSSGATIACASPPVSAERALSEYCEPLISGSAAAEVIKAARTDGFQDFQVGPWPYLKAGELILGVSDAPRGCLVQAPASMPFAQGIGLIDAWAARHPGAMRGAAAKGPDGAPVKVWVVPSEKRSLLLTQQTNGRGQKVLVFILAPLPTK